MICIKRKESTLGKKESCTYKLQEKGRCSQHDQKLYSDTGQTRRFIQVAGPDHEETRTPDQGYWILSCKKLRASDVVR